MTIWQAIAWKDFPALSWPLWSHRYNFRLQDSQDWEATRTLTDDVRYWERLVHDGRVNHRLCGWINVEPEDPTATGQAWFHPIEKGVPGDARELITLLPWNYCLRIRLDDGRNYPPSRYYRAAAGEEHILRGAHGKVGLLKQRELQSLLFADTRRFHPPLFDSLCTHRPPDLGLENTWPEYQFADVMNVSRLNGQRRAMARHLSNAVNTLPQLIVLMEDYYAFSEFWYRNWYLLDIPSYYPYGIKQDLLDAISPCLVYVQTVTQFFNDIDPGNAGQEEANGRFGVTGDSIKDAANKLAAAYEAKVEAINHEQPFSENGEQFWTRDSVEKFWEGVRSLNQYMAPALFWDWMDSTRANQNSQVRGGYIPTQPDVDPSA
jgi:hypothetical protein